MSANENHITVQQRYNPVINLMDNENNKNEQREWKREEREQK